MKVLAVDTTETACSAALFCDGETRGHRIQQARVASERILPLMERLLDEAGLALGRLDGLAFGRGPGSFTGLRIAAGVVQGAAFAAGLPVAPVSSLTALAQGAHRMSGVDRVLAAFDARMDEVYWSACRLGGDGSMQCVGQEQVSGPGLVAPPDDGVWLGAGSGWLRYGVQLAERCRGDRPALADLQVDAIDVATLGANLLASGQGVPAEQALPVYLRDQVTG